MLKKIASHLLSFFKNEEKIFQKNPKKFWENIAEKHSVVYGLSQHDFGTISIILEKISAKKILDFGCGSGRLFPLYLQHHVDEIVGIDISEKTLEIAHQRYPSEKIKTFSKSIFEINFPAKYFDLIVCTRVLQHMKEDEIKPVIRRICDLSNFIYVNEMSESDLKTIYFIHQYHYAELFSENGYEIVETGMIDQQKYYLFGKK